MIAALVSEEHRAKLSGVMPPDVLSEADFVIAAYNPADLAFAGVLTAEAIDNERLGITWLYVSEEYRRQGGGRGMLDVLAHTVSAINAPDFIICCHNEPENEGLTELLSDCGFIEDRPRRAAILEMPLIQIKIKRGTIAENIVPLGKISTAKWEELCHKRRRAHEQGGNRYARATEDYSYYDHAYSVVALDGLGEPMGELLVRLSDRTIIPESFFAMGKAADKLMPAMIHAAVDNAYRSLPISTMVQVCTSNPKMEELVARLTGGKAEKKGEVLTHVADAERIAETLRARNPYRQASEW